MDLKNKKVKINCERIMKNKNNYSTKYLDFISKNKNTIFTVKLDKNHPDGCVYTFKENDTWLFWEGDLEVIK